MGDDRVLCDEAVRAGLLIVAQEAGLVARVGTVVSSGTVVWQAEEKRRLRRLTDATGLDMESAAVGRDGAGTRPADRRSCGRSPICWMKIFRLTSICFSGPLAGSKACGPLISRSFQRRGAESASKAESGGSGSLDEWFQHYAETDDVNLSIVQDNR